MLPLGSPEQSRRDLAMAANECAALTEALKQGASDLTAVVALAVILYFIYKVIKI